MTPEAISQWMLEELKREKYLSKEIVVTDIALKFSDEFTYSGSHSDATKTFTAADTENTEAQLSVQPPCSLCL